jgi:hypothetical protein
LPFGKLTRDPPRPVRSPLHEGRHRQELTEINSTPTTTAVAKRSPAASISRTSLPSRAALPHMRTQSYSPCESTAVGTPDHTAGSTSTVALRTSGNRRLRRGTSVRTTSLSFSSHTREIGEVTAETNLQAP